MTLLAAACLICALIPFVLLLVNLPNFRRPSACAHEALPAVSVLIPARNEERNIGALLVDLEAQTGCKLEIIVCNDHSTDTTEAIVSTFAQVKLISAPALPAGWNGKQHACWVLAQHARHDLLCWIDADVRLAPSAIRDSAEVLQRSRAACVSGFPREITRTAVESLLLPLIHFVLLGYLPLPFMRRSNSPAFAAGCGQFMLARRAPYFSVGGHAAIQSSRHDGIKLPRLFRRHHFQTDIFDATEIAHCRMYEGAAATWNGLLKNADEGIGSSGAIIPFTVFLVCGQILPFAFCWRSGVFAAAALTALMTRASCALRFRQSWLGVAFHPVSVLLLLIIQWESLWMRARGRQTAWRGRL
ncbi:MAG: glycosyltransferase [Acidobacteriaceae bacterium]